MDNKKGDKYYCNKINEQINLIIKRTKGCSYDEFMSDDMLIDATMFRLVQLSENMKCLSDDFKEKHPSVPWSAIFGFRNGIVHDYGKTDYTVVYEIISKDIYVLQNEFGE